LLERGRWTCSPAARPFVTARTSNRPPSATAQNLCHSELSLDTKSFPKARTHTHRQKKRDVSNAQVKNGPLKIEVKREIEREYSSSFFLSSIYVILSCLYTLRISTLK
jgi:hypothetical protein